MANSKEQLFVDVAKQLGHEVLANLFHDTAAQETEHAFAHLRLLHPELLVSNPDQLSDDEKQAILSRCLELAIEVETYEYTTIYPEFTDQAQQDRDSGAEAEFLEQSSESKQHAGLLTPIEQHHAETYSDALESLKKARAQQARPINRFRANRSARSAQ